MDHYGDCLRRHHSSPVVSDGGIDEPGRNCGHNDFKRQEKGVQKLRHRRSSIGVNSGMSIHENLAEVSLRGTDHMHHNIDYEDAIFHRK